MKTKANILAALFLFFSIPGILAQNQKSYNQNSARSNHGYSLSPGLDFSLSPIYSTSTNKNNDSLLFRGSGGGLKIEGNYFFGKVGIGFTSGFVSIGVDNSSVNKFLQYSPVPPDQLSITKSNQQNMFLLLGPTVRVGDMVQLDLHAKGGLFINNAGFINIQQKGAVRPAYRNESTSKSFYPGFQTGLNLQYKTRSDIWSFGMGLDYLSTKTEVNNYDARRAAVEGLKLSKTISDVVAGITIHYAIQSPRDHASGMATGRLLPTVNKKEITSTTERLLPTVNKKEINSNTERLLPTVNKKEITTSTERLLPTVNKREIAIDEPGVQKTISPSCGPVTIKTTDPDGSTEEKIFSCPDDAAAYERQTPKRDFGDRMSSGQPKIIDNKKSMDGSGIISGRVTWSSSSSASGIVTNNMMDRKFNTLSNASSAKGITTEIHAREASSGMATGKVFQPMFTDEQNVVCNPCMLEVKSNPLYSQNTMSGSNPFYENKDKRTGNVDEDCDGVNGLDVFLLDVNSRQPVAKTTTSGCGKFWFANVPYGDYVVKISGTIASKKGYDMYIKNKTDVAGKIAAAEDNWKIWINTENNNDNAKTAINNSHSNIKNLVLIEADVDGDGEFESSRVKGTFEDGTSKDIVTSAKTSGGTKSFVLEGEALMMRKRPEVLKSNRQSNKHLTSISITTDDAGQNASAINNSHSNIKNLKAIATFSDGTTEDVTEFCAINTSHSNIKQYNLSVADLDDDGFADAIIKTKTKSNQSNDRMINPDVTDDAEGVIKTKTKSNQSNDRFLNSDGSQSAINTSHSNIKNLRVATGDVNGDGLAETVVGGFVPGGSVVSAALRPGDPIPDIDVTIKTASGGNEKKMHTNNYGEFEFTNLAPGNYSLLINQEYYISDETLVSIGESSSDEMIVRGWDPVKKEKIVGGNDNNDEKKLQNNNTVRSNRTEFAMTIIDADLDGDGEMESSYLSVIGVIGEVVMGKPGMAKLVESSTKGVKQTMQQQVRTIGSNEPNADPVKWIAPVATGKRVWGDPHVDEKDGSLKLGSGNFGTVYKGQWRSSDVAIKTVRCDDGTCRIITAKSNDYPDAVAVSLNGLPPGEPIGGAEIWLQDSKGKIYKRSTDANGRLSLNGLPPGEPYKIIVNIGTDGSDDVIIKFPIKNGIQLSKARHDIAMNAIRNMKG
jgi:hypothetical protein